MYLDHVAIVVKDCDEVLRKLSKLFSLDETTFRNYDDMRVCLTKINNLTLEIITPTQRKNRYWEDVEKGGGLHHLAFKTMNLKDTLQKIEEAGLKISSIVELEDSILLNIDPSCLQGIRIQLVAPKSL